VRFDLEAAAQVWISLDCGLRLHHRSCTDRVDVRQNGGDRGNRHQAEYAFQTAAGLGARLVSDLHHHATMGNGNFGLRQIANRGPHVVGQRAEKDVAVAALENSSP